MYASIYLYLLPTDSRNIAQAGCLPVSGNLKVTQCRHDIITSVCNVQIREWLFTIGYTFAYGALLAKLWRVYKIFHNPAPNKRVCTLQHAHAFYYYTGMHKIMALHETML